ncbi:hypothetical protein [Nostoc sp. JL33]|nr:hypothetical protein [Nostoc sp. JL33]
MPSWRRLHQIATAIASVRSLPPSLRDAPRTASHLRCNEITPLVLTQL